MFIFFSNCNICNRKTWARIPAQSKASFFHGKIFKFFKNLDISCNIFIYQYPNKRAFTKICKTFYSAFLLFQELFIHYLTEEAHLQAKKGHNLDYKHLAEVVQTNESLEFLREIMPRKITVRQFKQMMAAKNAGSSSDSDSDSQSDSSSSSDSDDDNSENDSSDANENKINGKSESSEKSEASSSSESDDDQKMSAGS